MATQGIVTSYFGLIDDKTGQLIKGDDGLSATGIYEVDGHPEATAEGATQIQINSMDTAPTLQYANDKAKRSTHPRSYPTAEFTLLDIGFEAKQKLLGKVTNGKGRFVNGIEDAHVAAIAVTRTLDKRNKIYYAFANGIITEGNKTMGTNNAAETDSNDTMTLTTQDPIVDAQFDGEPYAVYTDLISAFKLDDLFVETFPGYTAATVPPAGGQG
ncbi:small major structural protein [Leuconostoc kimchii IMSNU 11154]|uniref:Small major structural protein n=1 Tax=Leuconostoc kimchii (strain IMSNU 11154 / KCTC 2386 / IH25) TaxID=762051 RepID=D5T0U6_LEUKI|nr:phage tail protein [Leuconostoc kimchii]ADG39895.1 small major structural protein [Leuconostoc kimchii IMSNU 11154]